MRAYYKCYCDGRECDKAIPKFDKKGYLIQEPNKEIKEKYKNLISQQVLCMSWDKCDKCDRNDTIDGFCHGKLDIGE